MTKQHYINIKRPSIIYLAEDLKGIFQMFAAVLSLVVCSVVLHSSVEEELQGTFRACGRALADTLHAVCITFNKRSNSAIPGSNYLGQFCYSVQPPFVSHLLQIYYIINPNLCLCLLMSMF